MRLGGQRHPPSALPLGKTPGIHCIGGSVGLRASLEGCRNITSTGIRSPGRPDHSESLYRLLYPWLPLFKELFYNICTITARQIMLVVSEVTGAYTCFDTDGPSAGGTPFLRKRSHNSHSVWRMLIHLLIRRGLFTLELP